MRVSGAPRRRFAARRAPLVLFCAWFSQTASAGAGAAPMRFEHLGVADGLSQQSANAIAQDRQGFLWIGTEDGLDRIDLKTKTLEHVPLLSLPAGLGARAANADGTPNERGISFAFEVAPTPWATWKAYMLYVIAVALAAVVIVLARRRRNAYELIYMRRLEADVLNRTRELVERNAELERVNEKLEAASLSDPLTGLGNRRSLGHAMPTIASRVKPKSERLEAEHMILMVIDLDRLKPINDEFGHEAGDRLLAGVSAILMDCVRSADKVVRWGGDEFVVVSAPLAFDGGAALAERIRANVARRRFPISQTQLARTSCSIGFARYPFVEDDPYLLSWEQTLNIADVALYRAKARRNTWIGWTGTRNAVGLDDLPGLIAANPMAAVNGGLIDERTCAHTNDETNEQLLRRKCS